MAIDLGIPMSNNDGANRAPVSEHTIMLILAVYCRLLYYANLARWRLAAQRGVEYRRVRVLGGDPGLGGYG